MLVCNLCILAKCEWAKQRRATTVVVTQKRTTLKKRVNPNIILLETYVIRNFQMDIMLQAT